MSDLQTQAHELLQKMGVDKSLYTTGSHQVTSPIDGAVIGTVAFDSVAVTKAQIDKAKAAFRE